MPDISTFAYPLTRMVSYADDNSHYASSEIGTPSEAATVHETPELFSAREDAGEIQQGRNENEHAAINNHQRNHRNQRNQFQQQAAAVEVRATNADEAGAAAREEQKEAVTQKERCPHHPRAQSVRFDPAGQAWCDKLDCWDCYRLMKIGEALGYRSVTDRGGSQCIDQGMEAWAAFVLTERAFAVTWATQEALALCQKSGVEVPDLSGEVKNLVKVPASTIT